jgi:hypothetical protein
MTDPLRNRHGQLFTWYYIINVELGTGSQVEVSIVQYGSTNTKQQTKIQKEAKGVLLPHLQARTSFLLDLSLRFSDMPGVHDGKSVGHDLQRHKLELPRLRRVARFWESVKGIA